MDSTDPPPTPTSPFASSPESVAIISPPCWESVNAVTKFKKPRMSAPKVKTGCRTCKLRRVKCDEEKPGCRRCIRFHGECDGYEVDTVRSSSKTLQPKPLPSIAPKTTNLPSPESPLHPAVTPDVWPPADGDDIEQHYLQHFLETAQSRCSEYMDESLWKRIDIAVCLSETSIRYAVLAIGALDTSLENPNLAQKRSNVKPSLSEDLDKKHMSHYQFAIQYYDRAVETMQEKISNLPLDIKSTLIASAFLVCFEKYHGNHHKAFDNAHNRLSMVHSWLTQFVKHGIIPTSYSISSYSTNSRSSSPRTVEDELINAFARLDSVTKLLEKEKTIKSPGQHRPSILEICQFMPRIFLSVEEAKMYWDLIWKQTLQYLASTKTWSLVLGFEDSDQMPYDDFWEDRLHDGGTRSYEQDEDYLSGLLQWSSAFEPLFLDSQSLANQKNYAVATSLAVQSKAYYLAVAAGFCGEMYCDRQMKTCKEILSLAESYMLYMNDRSYLNQATYIFEQIVTRSIYMVARMCRDRGIRRKAILLIKSAPQRDGSWDSLLMARVATISMEIEEQKMEGQFVPERARIKTVKIAFNMAERTGKLFYVKAKPDPGWEGIVEEAAFSW